MRKIAEILMRRDGISKEEADFLVKSTLDEIDEAVTYGAGIEEVEDIVMDNLGLEPDYVEKIWWEL